jgi:hypothetical protein
MKIKKNGLIYRLAYVYNPGYHSWESYETDICELTSRALVGLVCAAIITVVLALASFLVGDIFVALYIWATTGFIELTSGIAMVITLGLFVVMLLCVAGAAAIKEQEPIRAMIHAHKNKYCFKVRIEE